MIYHDLTQQSPEWFQAKIGIPSGSGFDNIITPGGKPCKGEKVEAYANRLISEIIMGAPQDKFQPSYWMERGAAMEVEARSLYELTTGLVCDRGGWITNDEGTVGVSPDVRVGYLGEPITGCSEIKCPSPWVHVENLCRMYKHGTIDPAYKPQVQGQILIGEFEFNDWFSYHPDMPPARIRTTMDVEFCEVLDGALKDFVQMMDDKMELLRSNGVIIKRPDGVIIPDPEAPINDILYAG